MAPALPRGPRPGHAIEAASAEACISAVSRVLEHSWRMVGATAATGAAIAKCSRADSQLEVEHIKQRCIICMHAEASKFGNIALVTSRGKNTICTSLCHV